MAISLRLKAQSALLKHHGRNPAEIAEDEGIEVVEVVNMPERLLDIFVNKTIFIPKDLLPIERVWRVAHCLGHHFLHSGNQVWCDSHSRTLRLRQEYQADTFAVALLTINPEIRRWTARELKHLDPQLLARYWPKTD